MANALREFWPTGVLFLVGLGFDLSPVRSDPVAYVLWALAALWALYAGIPQINRIRVGLKPPDAELREALEARDRWREHFEAKQSEVQKLNVVREQQLEKIREVEQVLQRLRDRNEQLDQLNKNLQAERDQLSDLLQETKRENAKLKQDTAAPEAHKQHKPGYWDDRQMLHAALKDFSSRTITLTTKMLTTITRLGRGRVVLVS